MEVLSDITALNNLLEIKLIEGSRAKYPLKGMEEHAQNTTIVWTPLLLSISPC